MKLLLWLISSETISWKLYHDSQYYQHNNSKLMAYHKEILLQMFPFSLKHWDLSILYSIASNGPHRQQQVSNTYEYKQILGLFMLKYYTTLSKNNISRIVFHLNHS